MLPNYTKLLLDLEGVAITNIQHAGAFVKLFLMSNPTPHRCPVCGLMTSRIHEYRSQTIKDLPFQLKHCYLVLRKRRYACSCGKRFFEHYSFLPRYLRRTSRLTLTIAAMLCDTHSLKSIAQGQCFGPDFMPDYRSDSLFLTAP